MSRRVARSKPCNPQDAARRLRQADAFAALAELDPYSKDGPSRSAAVSNAVLAGIAAADAVCCKRLGRHSRADNHEQALSLLEEVSDVGKLASGHLNTLLSIKNKAQYEEDDATVTESAIRAMKAIIDIARTA